MKTFIAYALVASGIPNLVGYFFGMIITIIVGRIVWLFSPQFRKSPILWASSEKNKNKIFETCMGVASGFGAVFTAALIFHLLRQPLGLTVLLIIIVWKICYFSISVKHGQTFLYMFWSLLGVLIGWYDVFRIFSF
jgi:hypothetical protein